MIPDVELVRTPLQLLRCDALAFGAKNTGEIGGGAAVAILRATGPRLLEAGRQALAKTNRQIGDVAVTRAFELEEVGVMWICHVVSIIKHTPQGAWCPKPERLEHGVFRALVLIADLGGTSVAFAAMGTGEGRVPVDKAAFHMLSGVKRFRAEYRATS